MLQVYSLHIIMALVGTQVRLLLVVLRFAYEGALELTVLRLLSLLDDTPSTQHPKMGIRVSDVLRHYATFWTHLCRRLHTEPVRKGQGLPQTMALGSDVHTSRRQHRHCHHAPRRVWV